MILPSKQDREAVRRYFTRPDPSISSHLSHIQSRAKEPDACGTLWASFIQLAIPMLLPLLDAADELERRRSETDDKLCNECARLQEENDKLRCQATGGCVWKAACSCHESGYMTDANGRCYRCGAYSLEKRLDHDDVLSAMTSLRSELAQLRASFDDLQARHDSEIRQAACEERSVCEHILRVFRDSAVKYDVESDCKEIAIRTWDKAIKAVQP